MSHLCMIGCGNMGFPLLRSLLAAPDGPSRITILVKETERAAEVQALDPRVRAFMPDAIPPDLPHADALLYAAKPQDIQAGILETYRPLVAPGALVMSIAAGVSSERFTSLAPDGSVVRIMPNTPAMIGEGVSACYALPAVRAHFGGEVEALFAQTGAMLWVEQEALMHLVTAVSGSGPAYLFAFLEACEATGPVDLQAMEAALTLPPVIRREGSGTLASLVSGERMADAVAFLHAWRIAATQATCPDGACLTLPQAETLVNTTFRGALRLAATSGKPFAQLRAEVTSKGGTTEAGLRVLRETGVREGGITALMQATTEAAVARSVALG